MTTKKPLNERERVKSDIKSYERNKRLRNLAALGTLGSMGATGVGMFKDKKALTTGGMSGAFLSGMAYGRARREERAALNRIKRYYDLREQPKLINVGAVLPMKKEAMLGTIAEAITALGTAGLHTLGVLPDYAVGGLSHLVSSGMQHIANAGHNFSNVVGSIAPLAIDVGFLPMASKKLVTKPTFRHAYVAAKNEMGIPLSANELITRGKSMKAIGRIKKIEGMKPGRLKNVLMYYKGVLGPPAVGGELGSKAGKVLKEVEKVSPSLAAAAVEAIDDNAGAREYFVNELSTRLKKYQQAGKILDSTLDEIPGARALSRLTGKGGKSMMSQVLEHPDNAARLAESLKKNVHQGVGATKAVMTAGALAGLGALVGNYRKQHPLSRNTLPAQLATDKKRGGAPNPPLPLFDENGPSDGDATRAATLQ